MIPHCGGGCFCLAGLVAGLFRTSWTFMSLITQRPFSKTWAWNSEAMLEYVLRGGGEQPVLYYQRRRTVAGGLDMRGSTGPCAISRGHRV